MAIKATAHVVAISPYDEENNYIEVRIVAKRNDTMEATNQLFVIPISADSSTDIRDEVQDWLVEHWSVVFDTGDTISLYGGATII